MKKLTGGCALLLALSMPTAQAINQEIRALFQPDSSQPGKNLFVCAVRQRQHVQHRVACRL
jgi:hypothetical protein